MAVPDDSSTGQAHSAGRGVPTAPGSRAVVSAANRFGLDYRAEAARMGPPVVPIIDAHTHIHGKSATPIYKEAARAFGVHMTFSQTRLDDIDNVRNVLGDSVRFIAIPAFAKPDRAHAFGPGYVDDITEFHKQGARMVKLWNAPRLRDWFTGPDRADYVELDGKWRVKAAERASELGMMLMAHVADPDTWFNSRYSDASKYGTKMDHYRGLRVMLKRFTQPWMVAHMGGWPEDLNFLDSLLEEFPHLNLDTSATKWILRELSKHPADRTRAFFQRWQGRLIFGSDIVTMDEHVTPRPPAEPGKYVSPMADLADSPEAAFDLYASRYYALRVMFEGKGDRESPIADPDLKMVEPTKFTDMSAPTLRGLEFTREMLRVLYAGPREGHVINRWYQAHGVA
ncbi:MAG: hypothetical protein SFY96_06345 [Planctomycetota bacterium]|nr:hypothetical protein [Planctomycetota bacterium]